MLHLLLEVLLHRLLKLLRRHHRKLVKQTRLILSLLISRLLILRGRFQLLPFLLSNRHQLLGLGLFTWSMLVVG